MANKPLTTTVIGSFPKPSYLPIEDWFDGARNDGGMNTERVTKEFTQYIDCLLYTSPSPRDRYGSRMPSSA